MDTKAWRTVIGDMVKDHWRSPEIQHYFAVKMTKKRAQVMLRELAVFVRHRRDGWAYVAGNCPEWSVKQKILEHEYGEVIKDKYSEYGHLDLLIRQGIVPGIKVDTGARPLAGAPDEYVTEGLDGLRERLAGHQ